MLGGASMPAELSTENFTKVRQPRSRPSTRVIARSSWSTPWSCDALAPRSDHLGCMVYLHLPSSLQNVVARLFSFFVSAELGLSACLFVSLTQATISIPWGSLEAHGGELLSVPSPSLTHTNTVRRVLPTQSHGCSLFWKPGFVDVESFIQPCPQ